MLDFGLDFASYLNFSGYHTEQSQSLPSIILRGVTHGPSHFLTLLHRPLRDSVTKINEESYSTKKGLYFAFSQKVIFYSPQYGTSGSEFFSTVLQFEYTVLTHWSVAQAGSNYEKSLRSKIT